MNPTWFAVVIFLITYAFIVSDRVHRTIAALTGMSSSCWQV
jgi:Na+/H+ antiporter NhaD/arsenite permease-like protein